MRPTAARPRSRATATLRSRPSGRRARQLTDPAVGHEQLHPQTVGTPAQRPRTREVEQPGSRGHLDPGAVERHDQAPDAGPRHPQHRARRRKLPRRLAGAGRRGCARPGSQRRTAQGPPTGAARRSSACATCRTFSPTARPFAAPSRTASRPDRIAGRRTGCPFSRADRPPTGREMDSVALPAAFRAGSGPGHDHRPRPRREHPDRSSTATGGNRRCSTRPEESRHRERGGNEQRHQPDHPPPCTPSGVRTAPLRTDTCRNALIGNPPRRPIPREGAPSRPRTRRPLAIAPIA